MQKTARTEMQGGLVIVRANGPIDIGEIGSADIGLDQLQKAVGGYIESIGGWTREAFHGRVWEVAAFCNEEGKFLGLPVNQMATLAWRNQGVATNDVLVGDVAIVYGDRRFMRRFSDGE